jgi:Uma2 family endonuclease
MAVAAHIPVEEYLRTVYRPDCDYVDGEVIERNVGERLHSQCQGLIYAHFLELGKNVDVFAFVEWRVQVARGRFRVPDLLVVAGAEPQEDILTDPPLIAIEVLSPEDRLSAMQSRLDDYLRFGVRYVWLVDPRAKRAWIHTAEGAHEAKDLMLRTENPELVLPLREIFERIC